MYIQPLPGSGSRSVDVNPVDMLTLRRRKTTSSSDADAGGSLRRTWTGSNVSLRLGRLRLNQVDATMIHVRGTDEPEREEAVLSTISTALGVLRDVAGALQTIPYAGAVAVAAVKVLEIRDVCIVLFNAASEVC